MIKHYMRDDVFIMGLEGEININSLTDMRHKVEESGIDNQQKVVIDLEKVSFFDSSGLGYLIVLIKQVRMNKGFIALCNPNSLVKRLLSTIRIERYIGIYDSLDDAVEQGLNPA